MTVFRPKISLRPADITCTARLRRPGHTGRHIAGLVPEVLDLVAANDLLEPKFIFETRRVVAQGPGEILLQDQTTLHAPLVAEKLPRMRYLAIGVCTIGAALGNRVNALFGMRKGLQALVLDEIGNAAIHKLARRAHRQIRRDAKGPGLQASSALSPGSDGFALDQQAPLCHLAAAHRIGVEIRGGVMMQPGKSLSFVIGLGKVMPRWTQAEDCRNCRAADHCQSRVPADGADA